MGVRCPPSYCFFPGVSNFSAKQRSIVSKWPPQTQKIWASRPQGGNSLADNSARLDKTYARNGWKKFELFRPHRNRTFHFDLDCDAGRNYMRSSHIDRSLYQNGFGYNVPYHGNRRFSGHSSSLRLLGTCGIVFRVILVDSDFGRRRIVGRQNNFWLKHENIICACRNLPQLILNNMRDNAS